MFSSSVQYCPFGASLPLNRPTGDQPGKTAQLPPVAGCRAFEFRSHARGEGCWHGRDHTQPSTSNPGQGRDGGRTPPNPPTGGEALFASYQERRATPVFCRVARRWARVERFPGSLRGAYRQSLRGPLGACQGNRSTRNGTGHNGFPLSRVRAGGGRPDATPPAGGAKKTAPPAGGVDYLSSRELPHVALRPATRTQRPGRPRRTRAGTRPARSNNSMAVS